MMTDHERTGGADVQPPMMIGFIARPAGFFAAMITALASLGVIAACGRGNDSTPAVESAAAPAATTLIGCVAQTGQPDVFLLSVAEPRDAQVNAPPGTALPRDGRAGASAGEAVDRSSPVPTAGASTPAPGSSQPAREASSGQGPAAGPTTTTRIATYRLVGARARDVAAHVGGLVEVTGSIQEPPNQTQQDTQQINGEFQVASARQLAKDCVR